MNSSHNSEFAMAINIVLRLFPASIQEALIKDDSFRQRYGLISDAHVSFEDAGLSIQRSKLFNGIREIFSGNDEQPVFKDKEGEEWRLEVTEVDGLRRILLSQKKRRLFLPICLTTLSQDLSERLAGFEREADDVNFPDKAISIWREKLSLGLLSDNEVSSLEKELEETPSRILDSITSELDGGTFSFPLSIPKSRRYYNQLVGKYQEGLNIKEYAHEVVREHIQKLMLWRPYDGFLFSLLLSSHSSNTSLIDIEHLEEAELIKAYKWLQINGDMFSQLGAVEIGLSVLNKYPTIEPYLKSIIEQIRDDDPDDAQSRFGLLSALVILVDGELSRTKVLRGSPPFWRRLASIAQASLIERCTISVPGDVAKFAEWGLEARAQPFYIQSLTDLRLEPRWIPDFMSSRQLKAEFICRIINSADQNIEKIESFDIHELLIGKGTNSLRVLIDFPHSFFPGPLEGDIDSQIPPPDELVRSIKEQLSEPILQPKSFATLVNSALIYRLDSDQVKLASKALRTAKHQLRQVESKELLFTTLRGLAIVAAVTRSEDLADELIILTRKSRGCDSGNKLSADEAMWIGLIAAASHSELADWCEFVGKWITEIAFQPLQQDEVAMLHSHVNQLCHIVPELWHTCGRAEAALSTS